MTNSAMRAESQAGARLRQNMADLTPAEILRLGDLQLVARQLVEGFLRGAHASAAKGSSQEYAEHRPYVPGDDLRQVDWRSWARTDRYYVKEFEDETSLCATLVVDTSRSMDFDASKLPGATHENAVRGWTKLRYAVCLAASLGYLFHRQQDASGLALIDSDVRKLVAPKSTARHLAGWLEILEKASPGTSTDLGRSLTRLADRLPRRSLAVVLSDLLDDPREIVAGVARLRKREIDVLVFHILDPAEIEFPFSNQVVLCDSENPERRERLDAREVRGLYLEQLRAHREVLRRGLTAVDVDFVPARTDDAIERVLGETLRRRRRRR